MERTIYEKRYKDVMEIIETSDKETKQESDNLLPFDKFLKSMKEDYVYALVPEREANKIDFLKAVLAYTSMTETTVKIIEKEFEIVASLDMDLIIESGPSKKLFIEMLSVADEFEHLPSEKGNKLYLTYYTHELYFKGEKRRNIQ